MRAAVSACSMDERESSSTTGHPMTTPADTHVLTLTPFYPSAGDERGGFVAEPLREIGAFGVQSTVIAVRPWHKERSQSVSSAPSAEWVRYPAIPGNAGLSSAGYLLYLRLRERVRRLHHSEPIQVLHAHAALPCGEATRRLGRELGIPVVVTVHGLDAYFVRQNWGVSGKRCAALCRRVYGEAQRVVCISEEVRHQVFAGLPELRNAEVVYNGVDPELFYSENRGPGRDPILASVGSLIAIKGHDVTLRTLAELATEFPALRCRIVGEGPELRRLQALSQELGVAARVEFLGRQTRTQVAELLRGSDVFALPSHYEGLGCAYLEAMASGLPTIAYRGQGIQEVIRHNENGILMSEHSAENAPRALAEVVRTLLKNEGMRCALGKAARTTVLEGFTLRHQAQALARIFASVVRKDAA